MPRIVRIAITLFIAASILLFLVSQRLQRMRTDIDAGLSEEAARSEGQMIVLGMLIAGGLAIGGFVLLIVTISRTRKKRLSDHG